jgi:hypothetical protein
MDTLYLNLGLFMTAEPFRSDRAQRYPDHRVAEKLHHRRLICQHFLEDVGVIVVGKCRQFADIIGIHVTRVVSRKP